MSPLFTGLSCIPTSNPNSGTCTQGTYPVYVISAQSVWDVQSAVNFARNLNLRLVIKNTGHDFAGKATGRGALSIRTHLFQDILFIQRFTTSTYSGPVFKVGSGVQGRELYNVAKQRGYAIVGGEGMVCFSVSPESLLHTLTGGMHCRLLATPVDISRAAATRRSAASSEWPPTASSRSRW